MSRRRRFSEREVIEVLIRQGAKIFCYRSKTPISLENLIDVEREHLAEIALGGADEPANCVYSLKEAHKIITDGTKATTAGSSKQRIAKVRRLRGELKAKRKRQWASRKMQSRPFSQSYSKS